MFQIDVMSRKPVYEQLVDQIERYVLMGVLNADEQIPSVRSMSTQLSVNPNTIQKAYSELDRRGVVYSVSGRGCFVSPDAREKIGDRKKQDLDGLTARIRELVLAGVPKERVIQCVDDAYEGGNADDSGNGSDEEI